MSLELVSYNPNYNPSYGPIYNPPYSGLSFELHPDLVPIKTAALADGGMIVDEEKWDGQYRALLEIPSFAAATQQAWFTAWGPIKLSGGKVVTWYDCSGNGKHVTQGTDANRPLWDTTTTTYPGVKMGNNLWLGNATGITVSNTHTAATMMVKIFTDTANPGTGGFTQQALFQFGDLAGWVGSTQGNAYDNNSRYHSNEYQQRGDKGYFSDYIWSANSTNLLMNFSDNHTTPGQWQYILNETQFTGGGTTLSTQGSIDLLIGQAGCGGSDSVAVGSGQFNTKEDIFSFFLTQYGSTAISTDYDDYHAAITLYD